MLVCLNLNIMSFGELLKKYVYSFRFRLGASLNCIIDNIYSSNVPLHSDIMGLVASYFNCVSYHSLVDTLFLHLFIFTCVKHNYL